MPGTWTTFDTGTIGKDNLVAETMLLLTDGSVLIHQDYANNFDGSVWMRLTPNSTGSYDKGIWSGPFRMNNQRGDFASGITADGKVYVLGGEYSDNYDYPDTTKWQTTGQDTPSGEIFDPITTDTTKMWSVIDKPPQFDYIRGDIASSGLANGHVLFGSLTDSRSVEWDPINNEWNEVGAGGKDGTTNEETWTLLPDGSVMTVEVSPSADNPTYCPSERYVPATGHWVSTGSTVVPLVIGTVNCIYTPMDNKPLNQSVNVSEIGPALLLADGTLFAIGATGNTAIYDPKTGTWSQGPSFPPDPDKTIPPDPAGNTCVWTSPSGLQGAADAPAVLLPGGQVLCCAGNLRPSLTAKGYIELDDQGHVASFFNFPTNFYEYDPSHPQAVLPKIPGPAGMPDSWTWMARLLLLPNGQVLYSACGPKLGIYTPSPEELTPAVPRPTIANFGTADFPATLTLGKTYKIAGNNLNGFSQANSYGDDAQMATNFPLVRVSNKTTQAVAYLRTFNFSSLGVAVVGEVTCNVDVSADKVTPGTWELVVIANAVASLPVTVQIAAATS